MAQPSSTLQDILLGALLHDIGKAVQRASPNPRSKKHQEFGAQWLQEITPIEVRDFLEPAVEFVLRHHTLRQDHPKYEKLDVRAARRDDLLIVWEADNLSSGSERYKEDPDEPSETVVEYDPTLPLFSVLQRIRLDRPAPALHAYPPLDLGDDADLARQFYPQDPSRRLQPSDYDILLQGFADYLQTLPQARDPIQHLLNGLERFFSTVPSETGYLPDRAESYPDVSLYDHLKTTAAIATALYLYFLHEGPPPGRLTEEIITNRSEPRYLLVGGDFSGVQDFIYNITYRAALKGLRARSLYLELLTEHVVQQLLDRLNLSRANLIYSGGGGFYLLAPNTQQARDVLQEVREAFNRWLFQEHEGRLFLALDALPLSGNSFIPDAPQDDTPKLARDWSRNSTVTCTTSPPDGTPKLARAWRDLRQCLWAQKRHRFADLLTPEFFAPRDTQDRIVCSVCKRVVDRAHACKDQAEDEEEPRLLCVTCYNLKKIGQKLPRTRYIVAGDAATRGPKIHIQNLTYTFLQEPPTPSAGRYVFAVNAYENDAIPLFVANHPGEPLNFHELVEHHSVGAPLLATLRADVDNLGRIFAEGLQDPYRSFARYTTLSRLLTLFFKRVVNLLAGGTLMPEDLALDALHPDGAHRSRGFAVVYSGGDDLFITGAWADVVPFAFEVQRAFQRFVGHNPNLTLSAGIVLTGPKHPIYRVAHLAGDAEERAKAHEADGQKKDALALFGVVHSWSEWQYLLETHLYPLLNLSTWKHRRLEPRFARSLIYKLLDLHRQARDLQERGHDPVLVLPRLLYTLGRAKPRLAAEEQHLERHWQAFVGPAASHDTREALQWLLGLKGPLTWLDLLVRGGEES